jgi:acetyl-CoA synthetase
VSWGELQDLAARSANVLRDHGVERGDRVAMLLPPIPETAAMFFGTWTKWPVTVWAEPGTKS